jgi:hypothetical protein
MDSTSTSLLLTLTEVISTPGMTSSTVQISEAHNFPLDLASGEVVSSVMQALVIVA